MPTVEQAKAWDSIVDELFKLDAQHPYLGQTIEDEPSLASRSGEKTRYAEWREQDHPRGQPDNAGQFREKGTASQTKPKAAAQAKPIAQRAQAAFREIWDSIIKPTVDARDRRRYELEMTNWLNVAPVDPSSGPRLVDFFERYEPDKVHDIAAVLESHGFSVPEHHRVATFLRRAMRGSYYTLDNAINSFDRTGDPTPLYNWITEARAADGLHHMHFEARRLYMLLRDEGYSPPKPPVAVDRTGQELLPGLELSDVGHPGHGEDLQFTRDQVGTLSSYIRKNLPDNAIALFARNIGHGNRSDTILSNFRLDDGSEITLWNPSKTRDWEHSGDETMPLSMDQLREIPKRLGWDQVQTQGWLHAVKSAGASDTESLEEAEGDYKAEQEAKREQKEKEKEKRRQQEEDERRQQDEDEAVEAEEIGDDVRVEGGRSRYSVDGGKYYMPHEIAKLVGAQPGSRVMARQGDGYVSTRTTHPFISEQGRTIYKDHIHNDIFIVEKAHRGSGFGAKVFAAQVEGATNAGLDYIETGAAGSARRSKRGDDTWNGYYTWPVLGYDAPLDEAVESDAKYREALSKFGLPAHGAMLTDLIEKPGGAAWLKENGQGTTMKFDLRRGSKSRRILAKYLKKRFGGGIGWRTYTPSKKDKDAV